MNSASKAMAANQLALSVSSNDIANAGNPDFTRQRLVTTPSSARENAFGIGTGVDAVGIQATRDALIEPRLEHEMSSSSGAGALTIGLSNIEVLFNDSEGAGLPPTQTGFFNSFHPLALESDGDYQLSVIGSSTESPSGNLQAPLLVNYDKMLGKHVVLTDSSFCLRQPLL